MVEPHAALAALLQELFDDLPPRYEYEAAAWLAARGVRVEKPLTDVVAAVRRDPEGRYWVDWFGLPSFGAHT